MPDTGPQKNRRYRPSQEKGLSGRASSGAYYKQRHLAAFGKAVEGLQAGRTHEPKGTGGKVRRESDDYQPFRARREPKPDIGKLYLPAACPRTGATYRGGYA